MYLKRINLALANWAFSALVSFRIIKAVILNTVFSFSDCLIQVVYKSDLEWLRGIGWLPNDSPEVKRVKAAQDLLSDNVYRTPIDSVKYTSIVDSPAVVLAKTNAEQLSIVRYNFLKVILRLETVKEKSHS